MKWLTFFNSYKQLEQYSPVTDFHCDAAPNIEWFVGDDKGVSIESYNYETVCIEADNSEFILLNTNISGKLTNSNITIDIQGTIPLQKTPEGNIVVRIPSNMVAHRPTISMNIKIKNLFTISIILFPFTDIEASTWKTILNINENILPSPFAAFIDIVKYIHQHKTTFIAGHMSTNSQIHWELAMLEAMSELFSDVIIPVTGLHYELHIKLTAGKHNVIRLRQIPFHFSSIPSQHTILSVASLLRYFPQALIVENTTLHLHDIVQRGISLSGRTNMITHYGLQFMAEIDNNMPQLQFFIPWYGNRWHQLLLQSPSQRLHSASTIAVISRTGLLPQEKIANIITNKFGPKTIIFHDYIMYEAVN